MKIEVTTAQREAALAKAEKDAALAVQLNGLSNLIKEAAYGVGSLKKLTAHLSELKQSEPALTTLIIRKLTSVKASLNLQLGKLAKLENKPKWVTDFYMAALTQLEQTEQLLQQLSDKTPVVTQDELQKLSPPTRIFVDILSYIGCDDHLTDLVNSIGKFVAKLLTLEYEEPKDQLGKKRSLEQGENGVYKDAKITSQVQHAINIQLYLKESLVKKKYEIAENLAKLLMVTTPVQADLEKTLRKRGKEIQSKLLILNGQILALEPDEGETLTDESLAEKFQLEEQRRVLQLELEKLQNATQLQHLQAYVNSDWAQPVYERAFQIAGISNPLRAEDQKKSASPKAEAETRRDSMGPHAQAVDLSSGESTQNSSSSIRSDSLPPPKESEALPASVSSPGVSQLASSSSRSDLDSGLASPRGRQDSQLSSNPSHLSASPAAAPVDELRAKFAKLGKNQQELDPPTEGSSGRVHMHESDDVKREQAAAAASQKHKPKTVGEIAGAGPQVVTASPNARGLVADRAAAFTSPPPSSQNRPSSSGSGGPRTPSVLSRVPVGVTLLVPGAARPQSDNKLPQGERSEPGPSLQHVTRPMVAGGGSTRKRPTSASVRFVGSSQPEEALAQGQNGNNNGVVQSLLPSNGSGGK